MPKNLRTICFQTAGHGTVWTLHFSLFFSKCLLQIIVLHQLLKFFKLWAILGFSLMSSLKLKDNKAFLKTKLYKKKNNIFLIIPVMSCMQIFLMSGISNVFSMHIFSL